MNIKQLELTAKSLAPVIKQYVKQEMDEAEARIREDIGKQIDVYGTRLKDQIGDVMKGMRELPEPPKMAEILKKVDEKIDEGLKNLEIDIPEVHDGKDGKDGQSFTIEDAQPIIYKAIDEIKAAIPEAIHGKDGADGKDGVDGKNGASVTMDEVQPLIDRAVETIKTIIPDAVKESIPEPVHGKNGRDGKDGRDAVQIELLPNIDGDKSYPRGTYAIHKGGLWRSFEQTQAERGWEVVTNGLHDIEVKLVDDRQIEITCLMSNGRQESKRFSLPTQIYKGVFKDGDTYQCGDTVTLGGSLWHCNTETKEKPSTCDDWTLVAKKGRDGKSYTKQELKRIMGED